MHHSHHLKGSRQEHHHELSVMAKIIVRGSELAAPEKVNALPLSCHGQHVHILLDSGKRGMLPARSAMTFPEFLCRSMNSVDMVLGCTVLTLVILGSKWGSENKAAIKNLRKNNPTVFVVPVMVASYFLISLFERHKIFYFGIIFPIVCKFCH